MGSKHTKENRTTSEVKREILKQSFKRKVEYKGMIVKDDEIIIKLQEGQLITEEDVIIIELTDGKLRLVTYDPYIKQIILFMDDGAKWILTIDNLNSFLKWKYYLSVSMRPKLEKISTNCHECHKKFSVINKKYNCKCCGKLFCENCCRFLVQLGFLAYFDEERICESCKTIVVRIKSEETGSVITKRDTKNFSREKSKFSASIHESIRREGSISMLKSGCPSALNTLS